MAGSYKVAVIPGDGTGPEVVAEGLKVLEAAAQRFGFTVSQTPYDFGGDRYLRTGETLPPSAINTPISSWRWARRRRAGLAPPAAPAALRRLAA